MNWHVGYSNFFMPAWPSGSEHSAYVAKCDKLKEMPSRMRGEYAVDGCRFHKPFESKFQQQRK